MKRGTTLITGAGSGIGLALAEEFARHGHGLFLTSRSEAELQQVSLGLSQRYNVPVDFFAQDLEAPEACQRLFEAVQAKGRMIDVLCNNAGLGYHGKFWEIPLARQLSTIRVNVEAPVMLTHLFVPEMVRRGQGCILNVASVAGFVPGPTMAIYNATKAFLLSWSEALAIELEDTAVTVTALCPGPTDTDFFPKADMVGSRVFQQAKVMAPQEVAAIGYRALMEGDETVVPGGSNKTMVFARRFLSGGVQAKLNQKFYENVRPSQCHRKPGDVRTAAERKTAATA